MSREKVELPREIVNRLLHEAQVAADVEVCGLLGAIGNTVSSCYSIPNVAKQPECRYLLDAALQVEAMKRMRDKGESLFAIYHSHPTSVAEPSSRDLEAAAYPQALYLIISLNTKGVLEMRGFRLGDDQAVSEVLLVLSGG